MNKKPHIVVELPSTSLPLHKVAVTRKIENWALEPTVQDYLKKFNNTEVKVYTHADCVEVSFTIDKTPIARFELRKTVEPEYYYSPTMTEPLKSIIPMLADRLKDIPKMVFKPIEFGSWRKTTGVETLCSYEGFSLKVNDTLDLNVAVMLKGAFSSLIIKHSDRIIKDTHILVDLSDYESESVEICLMRDNSISTNASCRTVSGKLTAVIYNRSVDQDQEFLALVVDTIFSAVAKSSVAIISGVITTAESKLEKTYSFRDE